MAHRRRNIRRLQKPRRPTNRIISRVITTHDSLTVIAAAVAAFAIILLSIAVRRARYARRAAYYATRRHSQDTANRQFLWAIALLFVAAGVFVVSRIIPQEPRPGVPAALDPPASDTTPAEAVIITAFLLTPDPAPTTEQTQSTQLPLADASPTPPTPANALPADTIEPQPPEQSPSPQPSPLPPEATPVSTEPVATETATPALNGKHLMLRAMASGIDPSGLPINPALQFDAGVPSIYIFFDFQNVPEGRRLRHNWFRDGGSVYFESLPWERSGSGNAAIDWSPPNGFDAGVYEVRVFLDDQLQFVANFEVK